MVSTFTPNLQLEEPGRGDDVGTWDTPINNNSTLLDLVAGAIAPVLLNNSNIVLSGAQFRSKTITFNSTLTGNVIITFPTSFTKSYEIRNICTGSSAFTITLATTSGGQVICAPPGESVDVVNDGTNLYFHNFGRIGTYWDYAGSSVPAWVSGCSIPPYVNCDGSVIASSIYPLLPLILGSSLLPNSKGKARFALDQGAGLISTAVFSGTAVGATGGATATTLSSLHLPKLIDVSHSHAIDGRTGNTTTGGGAFTCGAANPASVSPAFTGLTYGSSSQIAVPTVPPAYIGGLTLIRAG